MKVLVAIKGQRPKTMHKKTLKWAGRAGFTLKIFITPRQNIDAFHDAIDEVNHNHYLDIRFTSVINKLTPEEFAKQNGYDLILHLPDNLDTWKIGDGEDGTVLHFAGDVGKARVAFGKDPKKKIRRFVNGAVMVRV